MKPGVTSLPRASISSVPLAMLPPIAAILPSITARSASKGSPPDPSTIVPLRITRLGEDMRLLRCDRDYRIGRGAVVANATGSLSRSRGLRCMHVRRQRDTKGCETILIGDRLLAARGERRQRLQILLGRRPGRLVEHIV